MTKFGRQLRYLRNAQGVTQDELGARLGLSDATINRYEAGVREPDLDTLDQLANFFGVSVDNLLGRDGSRHPKTIREIFADRMLEIKGHKPFRRLAEDIKRKTGVQFSHAILHKYADPDGSSPTLEVIATLAQYAGKPVSWFFEEGDE